MRTSIPDPLSGDLIEEHWELTLMDLSRFSGLPAEELTVLVEEGIIEPLSTGTPHWRFRGTCLRRVRCAVRLNRDLGVNWAGTALALELLEELDQLRQGVRRRDLSRSE